MFFLFSIDYRYDCGTGMVVIGSSNRVKLGEWNTVTVHRKDWKGMLTLNNGPQAAGRSPVGVFPCYLYN